MRVGFDANVLTKEKSAAAHYLAQLVRGLVKFNPRVELVLFSADKVCVDYDQYINFPQVQRVTLDLSRNDRKGWPAKYIPALLKAHKIDIFHSPNQDGSPVFKPGRATVITVLGLGDWVMAGAFLDWWSKFKYKMCHFAWSRIAARTLTLSETTKKDLARFCRVASEVITVTMPGAGSDDLFVLTHSEMGQILDRYNLRNKDYIINSSGLSDKRHNVNFVLEGFAQYLRRSNADVKLVVTGSVNYALSYAMAMRKIERLGIKDKVILTGFIPDRTFYALLRNAKVSIVSSMYSGTSFALTESFVAGVPVIATDRGAFSEIAGEAAMMVDPYDPESLSEMLRRLLEDQVEHDLYVEKGVVRAKDFSWERMAQETLAVYQSLIK